MFTQTVVKDFSRLRRGVRRLAIVVGLACGPAALAQPLPFTGHWLPDDHLETQASHAVLTIKSASMSWSGPKRSPPACVREFVLIKENPGTVYADGRGTQFVAGVTGSLPTYLLKVSASTCDSVADAVRISFPLVYDRRHMEFIEYVNGKPVAARRFHRKK
jgi:hypothetical protein